jgi:hypothetical protein
VSSTDEVLDAIDHALRDCGTSPDAMRWTPDQPGDQSSPFRVPDRSGWTYLGEAAPGTCQTDTGSFAFGGGSLYWAPAGTPPPDPQPRRTVCTREELTGWVQRFRETLADEEVTSLSASAPVHPPPCLGCGRSTGGGSDAALTVGPLVDEYATAFGEDLRLAPLVMIATFSPCGCVLEVRERS